MDNAHVVCLQPYMDARRSLCVVPQFTTAPEDSHVALLASFVRTDVQGFLPMLLPPLLAALRRHWRAQHAHYDVDILEKQ